MASYNPYVQTRPDLLAKQAGQHNRNFFSSTLRRVMSFGMDYADMALKNITAVGLYENPNLGGITQSTLGPNDPYLIYSQRAVNRFLSTKNLAILDRAYPEKRTILQDYSVKQEIKDFVQIVCNETISYDDKNRFCTATDLPMDYDERVRLRMHEVFNELYNRFRFNDGRSAWAFLKKFIVEGYLAFEIVYDDAQRNVIGLYPLDPYTLSISIDPTDNKLIWIQYPEDNHNRRILLDSQVLYIAYSNINSVSEISYIEGLIRPYNLYRIIEETRVIFNVTNAAPYKKFTLPTKGLTYNQARQRVAQAMAEYEDKMFFDSNSGTVIHNGEANVPYNKEVWFVEAESGTASFELVANEGPNLNEIDVVQHFENALKRASQIPFQRLDRTTGGGNMFISAQEVTRDELNFSRFVDSIRAAFKEIIIKPLTIQMCLEFPELAKDEKFRASIGIKYFKDNLYEEWKQLQNMQARAEVIRSLYDLKITEDPSIFDLHYLCKRHLNMTDEDFHENEIWQAKSRGEKAKMMSGGEAGGEGGEEGGEGLF